MAEDTSGVRVAYDGDGDRWDEQVTEHGVRNGWFKHRRPDPEDQDGDELLLWQLTQMYGLRSLVLASEEDALERAEASRRAWAEEAMRLQDLVDKATVAMRDFRDRVRKVNEAETAEQRRELLQQLAEDAPRPVCAVHPEGGAQ